MKTETQTSNPEKVTFDFPLQILKAAEAEGEFHVVGYAATTDFDLQGDIITEEALQASSLDLLKNSTVLLNHDLKLPIGKVTKVEFDKHGLLVDVLVSKTEPEVIQKIKEGVLNKFSIRGQVLERERKYMPEIERTVNVIKRMLLVEVSLVSVPANPEARAIGWYVTKALEESDQSQGGTPMPEEQIVIEEIKPEAQTHPAPESPAPTAAPEAAKPQTPPPAPVPQPAAVEKSVPARFTSVAAVLDKIATLGGEAGPLALAAKSLLAEPSEPAAAPSPKTIGSNELLKMIAGEVAKQVEATIKAMPTLRKGLVEPEKDATDLKKQFDSLPPGQKLKAALAMQQK